MSGSKKTTVSEQTTKQQGVADWLQPYMQSMAPRAQALLDRPTQQYQGELVAPFSAESETGLQGLAQYAGQGMPGMQQGYGVLGRAMQGIDPGMMAMLRGAYGGGTQANELRGIASGVNPYLDPTFDRAANRLQNRVASVMSQAGMSGSGAQQDLLQQGLGDLATQIYGGAYEADQARRMGAASQLAGLEQADLSRGLQAGGMLSDASRARNAQGLQAVGMLPDMYQAGQMPYQDMLKVGSARDAQAQALLNAQRQQFEQGQLLPWQDLARYQAMINPLGQQFVTNNSQGTSTTTQRDSPLQQVLGAAMMASTLFGNPFGMAAGSTMMAGGR